VERIGKSSSRGVHVKMPVLDREEKSIEDIDTTLKYKWESR